MEGYAFNCKVGFNRAGGRLKKRPVSAGEVEPLGFNRNRKFMVAQNPAAEAESDDAV